MILNTGNEAKLSSVDLYQTATTSHSVDKSLVVSFQINNGCVQILKEPYLQQRPDHPTFGCKQVLSTPVKVRSMPVHLYMINASHWHLE